LIAQTLTAEHLALRLELQTKSSGQYVDWRTIRSDTGQQLRILLSFGALRRRIRFQPPFAIRLRGCLTVVSGGSGKQNYNTSSSRRQNVLGNAVTRFGKSPNSADSRNVMKVKSAVKAHARQ